MHNRTLRPADAAVKRFDRVEGPCSAPRLDRAEGRFSSENHGYRQLIAGVEVVSFR
jgi:hypothetical protein